MVAVRSAALSLDCIIGTVSPDPSTRRVGQEETEDTEPRELLKSLVSEQHLQVLAVDVNSRFEANRKKIQRLQNDISKAFGPAQEHCGFESDKGEAREDARTRKDRKRKEGMTKGSDLSRARINRDVENFDVLSDGLGTFENI